MRALGELGGAFGLEVPREYLQILLCKSSDSSLLRGIALIVINLGRMRSLRKLARFGSIFLHKTAFGSRRGALEELLSLIIQLLNSLARFRHPLRGDALGTFLFGPRTGY